MPKRTRNRKRAKQVGIENFQVVVADSHADIYADSQLVIERFALNHVRVSVKTRHGQKPRAVPRHRVQITHTK